MHQNLAVILWQFNYGKNSLIVLMPGGTWSSSYSNIPISACKFDIDLSSVIEETARRAAAVPVRSPKTSESGDGNSDKKRLNRYSENSDGGSSDSSGLDVSF